LAKTDDSFVEKLVAQIIKNVQVRVERIHIRYEDQSTRQRLPGAPPPLPFCVGITLNKLSVHTTDELGNPCFAAENVKFIHKVSTACRFCRILR